MRATTVVKASKTPKEMTFAEKHAKRMKRLRSLRVARYEARTLHHQEVAAEEARNKLPLNYEAKRHQSEWLFDDPAKREEAEKSGKNYNGTKPFNISATEAERLERKKKKRIPVQRFSRINQLTIRQYSTLVKNMPVPGMEHYEKQKQEYEGPNVIILGKHKDRSDQVIDRMVEDLEGQIAKRAKYSRMRKYDDDADSHYINYLLKVGIKIQ